MKLHGINVQNEKQYIYSLLKGDPNEYHVITSSLHTPLTRSRYSLLHGGQGAAADGALELDVRPLAQAALMEKVVARGDLQVKLRYCQVKQSRIYL